MEYLQAKLFQCTTCQANSRWTDEVTQTFHFFVQFSIYMNYVVVLVLLLLLPLYGQYTGQPELDPQLRT